MSGVQRKGFEDKQSVFWPRGGLKNNVLSLLLMIRKTKAQGRKLMTQDHAAQLACRSLRASRLFCTVITMMTIMGLAHFAVCQALLLAVTHVFLVNAQEDPGGM